MRDPDREVAYARRLLQSGNPAQALRRLQQVLPRRPDDTDVLMLLSLAHHGLQQTDLAVEHARRAVATDPDAFGGHLALGIALRRPRPDLAVRALVEAARIQPDSSAPHLHLAHAYSDLQQHASAYRAARETIRLEPEDPASHCALGYVAHDLDPALARRAYQEALALDPHHRAARQGIAALDAGQGQWDEASRGFAGLLAEEPDNDGAVLVLDLQVVQLVNRFQWLTLGTAAVLAMATFGAGRVAGAVWLAVAAVITGALLTRWSRPIRRNLPRGGHGFVRGFLRRDRIAPVRCLLVLACWLGWPAVLLQDRPEITGAVGVGVAVLVLGVSNMLSWLEVYVLRARASAVRAGRPSR